MSNFITSPSYAGDIANSRVDDVESATRNILKDLDGYVIDLTFTQNKNAQQQINQSIRQALDGYLVNNALPNGTTDNPSLGFANDANTGFYYSGVSGQARFVSDGNYCVFFGGAGNGYVCYGNEVSVRRTTTNTLGILNHIGAAAPCALQLYNTNDTVANPVEYERLTFQANTGADYTIRGEAAGGGKAIRGVSIYGFTAANDGYFAASIATGGRVINYQTTVSGSYTVQHADHVLLCDTSGAPCNISIPVSEMVAGRNLVIKDKSGNAGANNIVISTTGTEQIDGADTKTVSTNWVSTSLISDGNNWFVI